MRLQQNMRHPQILKSFWVLQDVHRACILAFSISYGSCVGFMPITCFRLSERLRVLCFILISFRLSANVLLLTILVDPKLLNPLPNLKGPCTQIVYTLALK